MCCAATFGFSCNRGCGNIADNIGERRPVVLKVVHAVLEVKDVLMDKATGRRIVDARVNGHINAFVVKEEHIIAVCDHIPLVRPNAVDFQTRGIERSLKSRPCADALSLLVVLPHIDRIGRADEIDLFASEVNASET